MRRVGSAYQVRPEVLQSLAVVPGSPLFEADSSCGVFWVRSDGRAIPTQNYDNGADYFCDGLARYLIDGKYGYVNARLEVVVPASYDFAYPFQGGHGAVCQSCTFTAAGEHTSVACARCGAVDATGKLVLPVSFSAEQIAQRFPGSPEADCPVLAPGN
jgi:hypothetical protein